MKWFGILWFIFSVAICLGVAAQGWWWETILLVLFALVLSVFGLLWWRSTQQLRKGWIRYGVLLVLLLFFVGESAFLISYELRAIHRWKACRARWEARGISFRREDYVPPEVPDEQNFAMIPCLVRYYGPEKAGALESDYPSIKTLRSLERSRTEICGSLRRPNLKEMVFRFLRSSQESSQTANTNLISSSISFLKAAERFLEVTKDLEELLEELWSERNRPFVRFPVNYESEDPAAIELSHLGIVRNITIGLTDRALVELALGQSERPFRVVSLIFKFAEGLQKEPFLFRIWFVWRSFPKPWG